MPLVDARPASTEPSIDYWLHAGPPPPTAIEALCEAAGLGWLETERVRRWLRAEVAFAQRRREQAAAQAQAGVFAMQDRARVELDRRLERIVARGDVVVGVSGDDSEVDRRLDDVVARNDGAQVQPEG